MREVTKMTVYQVVPNLSYGDGVGNDILAIDRILKESGITTKIYAIVVDKKIDSKILECFDNVTLLKNDDILLYHYAVGSKISSWFKQQRCKKVIIYHNITPASFYEPYDRGAVEACQQGLKQIKALRSVTDYCIADSCFNKDDLRSYGFKGPIDVLPIIIPFEDYEKTPNANIINKYSDGMTNIIFTGRIAPNKKQEDIILAFYYYQKFYNSKARLVLVGSYQENDKYYCRLRNLVDEIKLENVIFTGHIRFDAILAYYKTASLFLCMSEHEGFCIPLLEAMKFKLPIIAYDSTAVPETLGKAGICINTKNHLIIAGLMNRVIKDEKIQKVLIENEMERLEYFKYENIKRRFLACLDKIQEVEK